MNSNDKLIALLKYRFAEEEEQKAKWEAKQAKGKTQQAEWKAEWAKWKKQQDKWLKGICGIISSYGHDDIAMLERMVKFIEKKVVVPGHRSKLIGEYTDQPTNECNRVLTLTYGYLGRVNMRPNTWVARIYFTDDGPRIGLPEKCLKSGLRTKVHLGKYKGKDKNAFSPIDIKDFFKCPGNYLDWNKLKKR